MDLCSHQISVIAIFYLQILSLLFNTIISFCEMPH